MFLSKPQLIIIGVIAFIVIFFALVFTCAIPGLQKCNVAPTKIEAKLQFWEIGDLPDSYKTALDYFKTVYPGVSITYKNFFSEREYNSALLEALAVSQGPDIFAISSRDLPKNINKISPLPKTKLSIIQLRDLFPQTVEQDFAPQGTIYALPISIDTLALFYNRDIFDQAAIQVPTTWEEFQETVQKLVKLGQGKKIMTAGAAIGGSEATINQAVDILNLLMIQTGTQMVSQDLKSSKISSKEGIDALRFYTQFADPRNSSYTWNDSMPNAIDSFSQGGVGMIFEYASSIAKIREKNAFINMGIAQTPQPKNATKSVAYANYYGLAVSRQSKNANLAWDFILSLTTKKENVKSYLDYTKKPPAQKPLILSEYVNDPDFSVFAKQALIAHSWPQVNSGEIKNILNQAIQLVISNQKTPEQALKEAEQAITSLMSKSAF